MSLQSNPSARVDLAATILALSALLAACGGGGDAAETSVSAMGDRSQALAAGDAGAESSADTAEADAATLDAMPREPQAVTYTWSVIANEGQSFTVGTNKIVRYGRSGAWVTRTMTGAGICTAAFFGSDPAPGLVKRCQLKSNPIPVYTPPIVISTGGTYSGNWDSNNPAVAAVTVTTSQPVIIQNCFLRGKGHLVASVLQDTNITVRNCVGQGVNPNVANAPPGRFVTVYRPASLTVERNTLLNAAGIYADGAGRSSSKIKVRYNLARNIEGRLSNGAGGYLTTFTRTQFVQLNNVRATPNIEIAWNEVVNEPGKSRVEENINLYLTSGKPSNRIKIHDNYIQGAYEGNPLTPGYRGGGMMVDGVTTDLVSASGFINIYDNQVVGTQNQGIGIAAGHDIDVRNNRMIGSGLLPDGRRMTSAGVGIYVWNSGSTPGTFFNMMVTQNLVGWVNSDGVNSFSWFVDCAGTVVCSGNPSFVGDVTLASEQAERASWDAKLLANGVLVGSSYTR